jgi:hypothetical protein
VNPGNKMVSAGTFVDRLGSAHRETLRVPRHPRAHDVQPGNFHNFH